MHIHYSFIFLSLTYPLFSAFALNNWLSSTSGVGQHVSILVFGEYQGWDLSMARYFFINYVFFGVMLKNELEFQSH